MQELSFTVSPPDKFSGDYCLPISLDTSIRSKPVKLNAVFEIIEANIRLAW